MIDIERETILRRGQAARLLTPPGRKAMHQRSVYRMMIRGKRGVVLESVDLAGELCTSKEAVQRFLARLSERRVARPAFFTPPPRAVPAAKSQRHQDAVAVLAAAGI